MALKFDLPIQNVTHFIIPKMHQCCSFGENPSNTFQDIVLRMFGAQACIACTGLLTGKTHNVSSHAMWCRGIIKSTFNYLFIFFLTKNYHDM